MASRRHVYGDRVLSLREVSRRIGKTPNEITSLIKAKRFPERVVISERLSGWSEDIVHDWLLRQFEKQAGRKVK